MILKKTVAVMNNIQDGDKKRFDTNCNWDEAWNGTAWKSAKVSSFRDSLHIQSVVFQHIMRTKIAVTTGITTKWEIPVMLTLNWWLNTTWFSNMSF